MLAEDVRHLQRRTIHEPWPQTGCGRETDSGRGRRSSGLAVAQTVVVATTRRALRVRAWKEPVLRLTDAPPVAQHHQPRRREHHVPVPLPFPLDDAEHHPLAVNRRHGQPHGFRETEPGGVAGRQDGAMLEVLHAIE